MPGTQIKAQLRTFDMTMIVISLVIGMGIFRTPSEVAEKAGTPEIFFLAWFAGAVVSLMGALTFAEIGSRYPVVGGFYKIFSFCYSPLFAFMVNWITVISNAAANAAVAIMGSAYIAPLIFPEAPTTGAQVISIGMILFLLGINLLGIKVSSKVLNVLMFVKLSLLILLISCAFFVTKEFIQPEHLEPVKAHYEPWKAFLLCFIPIFFTFGGYQQTINFGGDVRNPSRTIPRSIFYGITVILILYMAVNYSYYAVLGMDGLAKTDTIAADVARVIFGENVSRVISIVMFFAVMTFVNVAMISNPRVYYAMAEDKVMPSAFMKVNPKTQVQVVGLLVFCFFILMTLLFMKSFEKILQYVMFFDSISLVAATAAIFILRRRAVKIPEPEVADNPEVVDAKPEHTHVYRMRAYPYIPIIFIIIYSAVNVSVFLDNKATFGIGIILFLAGYPLFYLIQMLMKRV